MPSIAAPAPDQNEFVIIPQTNTYQYYLRASFYDAGLDTFTRAPIQPQGGFTKLINVQPCARGVLERRWGYGTFSFTTVSDPFFQGDYYSTGTNLRYWIVSGFTGTTPRMDLIYEDGGIAASFVGTSSALRWAVSRGRIFVTDAFNEQTKWIGDPAIGPVPWGLPAPTQAPSILPQDGGNITLSVGRRYAVVFVEELTNTVSDISPLSPITGPLDNQKVEITIPLVPPITRSTTLQLDHLARYILATADGGDPTTLYLLAKIQDNTTTTYTDNTPDTDLLSQPVYLEYDQFGNPHGVLFNSPPPGGIYYPTHHNGRIFGSYGPFLVYSKNLDEVTTSSGLITSSYEDAFPAANILDVSTGGDIIRALISYNGVLYIGTHQHIYALYGDSPSNFSAPQVLFKDVGIISQDVAKLVFVEGQPAGFIWITPDFRVLQSDFNDYVEIGKPIYPLLRDNAPSDLTAITATYVGNGPYDLYVINLPYPNPMQLVYDLRARRWFQWEISGGFRSVNYGITKAGEPVFLGARSGQLFKIGPQFTSDNGVGIPVTIESVWLHFGDPSARKIFNEIDISTGDPNLTFELEGIDTATGFDVVHSIVPPTTPQLGPFGTYKVFVSGYTMKDHFYRYRIVSNGTAPVVLAAIRMEVVPINRL
jgi:hypothetical protein